MIAPRSLLKRYAGHGTFVRLYLNARVRLIDFEAIDGAVGEGKDILDLACGFGLVANFLARNDSRRTVLGLDLDPSRVQVANAAADAGATFRMGDITRSLPRGYDTITFLDSLHYFDAASQQRILTACSNALPPGGRLVLREQVNDRSWKAGWTYLHELIMTRLKMTLTRDASPRLNFVTRPQLDMMLQRAGFSHIEVWPSASWSPYTDTLFICVRSADVA